MSLFSAQTDRGHCWTGMHFVRIAQNRASYGRNIQANCPIGVSLQFVNITARLNYTLMNFRPIFGITIQANIWINFGQTNASYINTRPNWNCLYEIKWLFSQQNTLALSHTNHLSLHALQWSIRDTMPVQRLIAEISKIENETNPNWFRHRLHDSMAGRWGATRHTLKCRPDLRPPK